MNVQRRAVFQLIAEMILLSVGTEYPMPKVTRMSKEMCNFLSIPFSFKSTDDRPSYVMLAKLTLKIT